jgi:hypothetical protein
MKIYITTTITSLNRYSGWYIELLVAVYKQLIFLKKLFWKCLCGKKGLKFSKNHF